MSMDNVCSNKPKDMNSDCKETDFRISYPLHNMIYLKTTNPIPNIHYIHGRVNLLSENT